MVGKLSYHPLIIGREFVVIDTRRCDSLRVTQIKGVWEFPQMWRAIHPACKDGDRYAQLAKRTYYTTNDNIACLVSVRVGRFIPWGSVKPTANMPSLFAFRIWKAKTKGSTETGHTSSKGAA